MHAQFDNSVHCQTSGLPGRESHTACHNSTNNNITNSLDYTNPCTSASFYAFVSDVPVNNNNPNTALSPTATQYPREPPHCTPIPMQTITNNNTPVVQTTTDSFFTVDLSPRQSSDEYHAINPSTNNYAPEELANRSASTPGACCEMLDSGGPNSQSICLKLILATYICTFSVTSLLIIIVYWNAWSITSQFTTLLLMGLLWYLLGIFTLSASELMCLNYTIYQVIERRSMGWLFQLGKHCVLFKCKVKCCTPYFSRLCWVIPLTFWRRCIRSRQPSESN